MKQSLFLRFTLAFIALLVLSANGCAPVFSELQSARTVGQGNFEATAAYSSVNFSEGGDTENIQKHLGLQAAFGLSDRADLRIRYEFIWLDDDISVNVLGFGPKFSLVEDRLSVYVPVGFAFGGDIENSSDSWQVHPTLLGTIPIIDALEVNPSCKVLIPFSEGVETTVAVNLGLGIIVNETITIRPEYGRLFNPGEDDGSFGQFSVGMTFTPPGRSNDD